MRRTCHSIAKRYGLPHWAVLSIVHFLKFGQPLPNTGEATLLNNKLPLSIRTPAYVDMRDHAEGIEGEYNDTSTESNQSGRYDTFKS